MKIVLYDNREESETYKEIEVIYAGEDNQKLILIPPGVAHGYQVLGNKSAGLLYHTSEAYNPSEPDEERIPFDDSEIAFDWTIKNR